MKEVTKYLCDRCNGEAPKTSFTPLAYMGRNYDLCAKCARNMDSFLECPTPAREGE